MGINWEMVLSVITIVVAIIALFQTSKQLKINNKQALFDRRLVAYLRIIELVELTKQNENHLEISKDSDNFFMTIPLHFSWFTNSPELEKIGSVIDAELGTTSHKRFLHQLAQLEKLSLEARLIFDKPDSDKLSQFVMSYKKFLFSMFQYQILFNHLQENMERWSWSYEEACQRLGVKEEQENVMKVATQLKQNYLVLTKCLPDIENQIKL